MVTEKKVKNYLDSLPDDRRDALNKLRIAIAKSIPKGFVETISYGMPGFVVPHTIYPNGYHCKPEEPLPFVNYASQKNFVAFYHMGIYANPELLKWFLAEYPKYSTQKLDMGKSCIRFKKLDQIPYDLITELMRKITVEDWIKTYETKFKKQK